MTDDSNGPDPTGTGVQTPIARALNQTEGVKKKISESAKELSAINSALKAEITGQFKVSEIEQAVSRSENIEGKFQECAADLSEVKSELAQEIHEREKLERELTDSQTSEQEALHLAFHDSVTSLPNRNLFSDRLHQALAQAERHARGMAVMFIDLDKLKMVNDTWGHPFGDKVLQAVADRLQESVRAEDTVSRYGGDEFVALLLEINDEAAASRMVRKITDTLRRPCEIDGIKIKLSASIGIALYPRDGNTLETLLEKADAAMYKAKNGGSGYQFFRKSA